jgi:hypothetical protein
MFGHGAAGALAERNAIGWRYIKFFTASTGNLGILRANALGPPTALCLAILSTIRTYDVAASVNELQERHGAEAASRRGAHAA